MLPAAISVASENSVSNLTTPFDSPLLLLLPSDYPNPTHEIKKDDPYRGRVKRGYFCKKHDDKRCYKKKVLLLHVL